MGVKTAKKNSEFQAVTDQEVYSDFNHTFLPHPSTKQIGRKTNVDAVKLAVRNLILTNKYERLRNPEFGGNLSHYLFEPYSPLLLREISDEIKTMIQTYEPRVEVEDVVVTGSEDNLELDVRITFSVVTSQVSQDLDLTLYRVR